MLILGRRSYDALLLMVLVGGLLFIVATRVQPASAPPPPPAAVDPAAQPAPLPGHPAPDFTLVSLAGEPVTLSELRGQVVLVNIWATWCPPCRAEMPAIQAVYDQYAEQGFTVLAVNVREEPQTVAAYMQSAGLTFPALLDSDATVSNSYRANVLPSSFFVDRAGVVRAVYRGPMARSVISGTAEQLLAEER